jgi:hypothetical protein
VRLVEILMLTISVDEPLLLDATEVIFVDVFVD